MKTTFQLVHGDTGKVYGVVSFNGKFTFDLNESIDTNTWNNIGFIHLDDDKHIESEDLFSHLNSRLPIQPRNRSNKDKLDYIKNTGLRVASDSFFLQSI